MKKEERALKPRAQISPEMNFSSFCVCCVCACVCTCVYTCRGQSRISGSLFFSFLKITLCLVLLNLKGLSLNLNLVSEPLGSTCLPSGARITALVWVLGSRAQFLMPAL